jgi:hypothetical protein
MFFLCVLQCCDGDGLRVVPAEVQGAVPRVEGAGRQAGHLRAPRMDHPGHGLSHDCGTFALLLCCLNIRNDMPCEYLFFFLFKCCSGLSCCLFCFILQYGVVAAVLLLNTSTSCLAEVGGAGC